VASEATARRWHVVCSYTVVPVKDGLTCEGRPQQEREFQRVDMRDTSSSYALFTLIRSRRDHRCVEQRVLAILSSPPPPKHTAYLVPTVAVLATGDGVWLVAFA